ncbi:hypothetical protein [Spirosoma endbachense]|uniref:Uncharacterized protein n=1 Tax=Spirosoma endbachense TaxID=2666025 RepID=A0A6P1VSC1_9BACT|nr:hypothetical protein [Spirosoma endbachense]QHV95318.1 hypothetical protein GJR95_09975 [Spirosoma endbachense]
METTPAPAKPRNKTISQRVLKLILDLYAPTVLIHMLKLKTGKKAFVFFLVLVASIHFSSNSFAQARQVNPLDAFIENRGTKILARCAHPFNTYTEGKYSVDGSIIRVWVTYSNGTTETIQLHYNADGDYFDGVKCTAGSECSYSFMAVKMFSATIPSGERICLEKFFHSSFDTMSGEQMTAAGLTGEWWKWREKPCN